MAESEANIGPTSGSDLYSVLASGAINLTNGLVNFGLNHWSSNKAAKKQYKYALSLWNLENEYNKPINQMARLREAGLNPNLVYGNGANALAASTKGVSVDAARANVDTGDMIQKYQDLRQQDATIQQIQAQKKEIKARTDAIEKQVQIAQDDAVFRRQLQLAQSKALAMQAAGLGMDNVNKMYRNLLVKADWDNYKDHGKYVREWKQQYELAHYKRGRNMEDFLDSPIGWTLYGFDRGVDTASDFLNAATAFKTFMR